MWNRVNPKRKQFFIGCYIIEALTSLFDDKKTKKRPNPGKTPVTGAVVLEKKPIRIWKDVV